MYHSHCKEIKNNNNHGQKWAHHGRCRNIGTHQESHNINNHKQISDNISKSSVGGGIWSDHLSWQVWVVLEFCLWLGCHGWSLATGSPFLTYSRKKEVSPHHPAHQRTWAPGKSLSQATGSASTWQINRISRMYNCGLSHQIHLCMIHLWINGWKETNE